jgi:predicted phage terminase large subunit-like protein
MDKEYLGQYWLNEGFETWFRCLFRLIEEKPFVVEPIHNGLFEYFDKIYKLDVTRLNVNVPPRSGKTTLATYLLVYALTVNPKSNIIYTSFSQSLLTDIAARVRDILEHPIYKAMYPSNMVYQSEETNPIDDFWLEYLKRETGRNTYSSKKIVTGQGGTCLFSSIGSQITGYGAGIRNGKGFTGCLIIDDANKPADIHSQVMRDKVVRYYEETLLSRLNQSNVPIINIQQRLHLEDLSGVLESKYGFATLKRPLVDENGVCQLPSQYTNARIEELKVNNYMFTSQYQQEPIILGGAVIKREWFKYYNPSQTYNYNRIIITADTAMKVKEHNDYSVFIVGGITDDNKLHILNMVRGKWEAPELKLTALQLFEQYKYDEKTGLSCSGIYVEDKVSGVYLVQELQRVGIPVVGIPVEKDKLTRVESVLNYIASGQVLLPYDERYGFNPELLSECESFTRDDSHSHDDIVDTLVHAINEGIAKHNISLLDYFM